ncbi:FirrV-1-B30 precursor [Feldmannia irregularis virus a]|uniref:FirrV-1-B30 n=1 Tax=Feldmannia irregularis virus a TaxID=231992 RepID=Q6XM06_9PHYC|nr:FirrV-1-B30 precursor [Feldmannia irregularis virus a]AAR26905.1 FirrV-1-B30 precursor [Feldmannia irregularis virus a]
MNARCVRAVSNKMRPSRDILLMEYPKCAAAVVGALLCASAAVGEIFKLTPSDSIQRVLDKARPGDTLRLAEGKYAQDIQTVRSGITIEGSKKAVVMGSGHEHRIVEVNHSYTTLRGFTVSGKRNSGNDPSDYVDKCIFVMGISSPEIERTSGIEYESSITGVIIEDMEVEDCGGECIRLRSFVTHAEVTGNRIERCGRHDYLFDGAGKNGEAIYVGTSSNQWNDGKNSKSGPDKTKYIWIHDNVIDTQANECVDVKEGSTDVLVEYNACSNQLDTNSAGFDSRTDDVTFRYNEVSNCAGAGIRIGGHKIDGKTYGENNEAYGNVMRNNAYSAIKVETGKQHVFCQNDCGKEGCTVKGNRAESVGGDPDDTCITRDLRQFDWTDHQPGRVLLAVGRDCHRIPLQDVAFSNSSHGAVSADTYTLTRWSTAEEGGWVSMKFGGETVTVTGIALRFADGDTSTYQFHLYGDGNPVLLDQTSSGSTLEAERFDLEDDTALSELTLFADSKQFHVIELHVCGSAPATPRVDVFSPSKTSLDCPTADLPVVEAVSRRAPVLHLIGRDFSTAWTCRKVPCDIVLTLEQPSYVYQLDFSVENGDSVVQDFDVQALLGDTWEDIVTDQQSVNMKGTQSVYVGMGGVSKLKFIGYGSSTRSQECSLTTMNVIGCPSS